MDSCFTVVASSVHNQEEKANVSAEGSLQLSDIVL